MKNQFLEEAIRIGDQLIALGERDEQGIWWKTLRIHGDKRTWEVSEDMYEGVSGIVLFFLALYTVTQDETYLQTAEEGMRWIWWYCEQYPTDYYAFFTGRMGVAFTFLKLFEATKKQEYLEKALSVAKGNEKFISSTRRVCELINGTAGTLLGLLHLHAATQDQMVLQSIEAYTAQILGQAKFGKVGVYWDIMGQAIRPLCGFSHGTGGIGFVFLELGHYFQNPAFYAIAEQAFAYENYYFDKKTGNWPDFRLNLWTEAKVAGFKKLYFEGNLAAFSQSSDMNAWCHGAAGIGLSRLRAWELLGKEVYLRDNRRAQKKNGKEKQYHSFILCHGGGGNMDFFIEDFLISGNEASLGIAQRIAEQALEQKKKIGRYLGNFDGQKESPSLFTGIAGIGYFLLRVAFPEKIPSILAAKVPSVFTSKSNLQQLKPLLIKNGFLKTFTLMQKNKQIEQVFTYELAKLQIEQLPLGKKNPQAIPGILYIKQQIQQERIKTLLSLTDTKLLQQTLVLTEESMVYSLETPTVTHYLLKQTPYGLEETNISFFCANVLQLFQIQKTVKKALEEIRASFNAKTVTDKKIVKEKMLRQIREALHYGIFE